MVTTTHFILATWKWSNTKRLKNCSSLVRVRLDRNQLADNISEAFGVYPNLDYMDLSQNNLYGEQFADHLSLQLGNGNILP
ncbi:hypothetical protein GIB67_041047 [Kingdonia uniflora]|uniref:non-specific serine/threonine protein kinase n=1 Tax=Kingdonia uniflora TaxID=39325 RepID=A0A7J7LGA5_9MAGN|nr:hypothetical protein GIB67_041047 [Kingdonia uniflora]